MDYTQRLAISQYEVMNTLNEEHQIYLVRHRETGEIAVKKILDTYNPEVYAYLKAHPLEGTPAILAFCEENHQLYLIEEYIPGRSLLQLIEQRQLDLTHIIYYSCKLCQILDSMHSLSQPVIHRDVKPSNVIITPQEQVVLLDFNAAKFYNASEAAATNDSEKRDTVLLGTQGYAAPEQYGFGVSTPRTDIYGIGRLLQSMVNSLPAPNHLLDEIIECCTRMDPGQRYDSAGTLRKQLLAACPAKIRTVQNWDFGDAQDCKAADSGRYKSIFHTAPDYSKSDMSWVPPGFRSKTPWKIAVAVFGYFFWFVTLVSSQSNTTPLSKWICEFTFMNLAFFEIVLGSCNYRNIYKHIWMARHPNLLVRIFGRIVVIGLLATVTLFSMSAFEDVVLGVL